MIKKRIVIFLVAASMAALFISAAEAVAGQKDIYPLVKVRAPRFASYASTSKKFTVRWSAAKVMFDQQVVRFHVLYRRPPDRRWKELPSLGSKTTTSLRAAFTGEAGETYVFKVRGEAPDGRLGAPSIAKTIIPLDDNNTRYKKYKGAWELVGNKRFYQRAEHQSGQSGAVFIYRFDGRRVFLIGSKGPGWGQASVYLDGVSYGIVDFKARTFRARRLLWSSPKLKPVSSVNQHQLKLVVVGTPSRSRVGIDAVARIK